MRRRGFFRVKEREMTTNNSSTVFLQGGNQKEIRFLRVKKSVLNFRFVGFL